MVCDPTSANAATNGSRVRNRQQVVGHCDTDAMNFRIERDVVERHEHSAVDEEQGNAEEEESPVENGFAKACLGRFDLISGSVVSSNTFALLDQVTGDQQEGNGDESIDSVYPRLTDHGEELVDDKRPQNTSSRAARNRHSQSEGSSLIEPLGNGAGGRVEAVDD